HHVALDPAGVRVADDQRDGQARGGADALLDHRGSFSSANSAAIDGSNGGRAMPASVTMAVIRRAGVTSKAGLRAATPAGATRCSPRWVTSRAAPSAIGTCAPSGAWAS